MSDAFVAELQEKAREAMLKEQAHILQPASKLHDLTMGSKTKVKALCGAWVTKVPGTKSAVCRGCFDAYLKTEPGTSTAVEPATSA